jgi:hypothetical protein
VLFINVDIQLEITMSSEAARQILLMMPKRQQLIEDVANVPTKSSAAWATLWTIIGGGFMTNFVLNRENPLLAFPPVEPISTQTTNLDWAGSAVFLLLAAAVALNAWHNQHKANKAQQTLMKPPYDMSPERIETAVKIRVSKNDGCALHTLFGCHGGN